MRPRIRHFVLLVLAPVVLWVGIPLVAGAGKAERIRAKISSTQGKIKTLKGKEGVLTEVIETATQKIDRLQRRQNVLQGSLDENRAELLRLQKSLRTTRKRLGKLRAKLAHSRIVLSRRLVEIYQSDRPDIITVLLNAKGFADLLEHGEFIRRIKDQDAEVITAVRLARTQAKAMADRLQVLETRQQKITAEILERRDEVAEVKGEVSAVRASKAETLQGVKGKRSELEDHLEALEKEEAKISGTLQNAAGPIRRGSGRFIWPVNGTFTSPFGMRWGRLHAGIDIAAPTGTAMRASDGGTVQIAGWSGGYGQYTCIGHGGGISSCYGHQSSIGVSVGQNVSQGQVIGAVGSTGNSTGPHVHFEIRINGNPVDPMGYL